MRGKLLVPTFVAFAVIALPGHALLYDGGHAWAAGGGYSGAALDFGVSLDIGFCYNYLAPYGSWVSMERYGYVWCPRRVDYGWRPYSAGHWVWTDYGWTWISDEDWGWIPFHYGRWGWDDDMGWFWVPGTIWGPAWVTWRYNDDYCGWAPLPPGVGFQVGVGFRSLPVDIPGRYWVFVQAPHFLDHDVRSHALPYERNTTIINTTSIHNNIYVRNDRIVNEGIGLDDARRLTRGDVPRYSLRDVAQPGRASVSGHEVRLYRPVFQENPSARPSAVQSRSNARRESAPAPVVEPRQQPQQPKSREPNARTASAPAPVVEPRQQPKSPEPKVDMKKRQAEEKSKLQQTQSRELKQMQAKQSEEAKRAQKAAEKAQVKRENQSRMSELQKSQQAQRQQMAERHQREIEQSKGAHPAAGQGRQPEQAAKGKQEERAKPPGE